MGQAFGFRRPSQPSSRHRKRWLPVSNISVDREAVYSRGVTILTYQDECPISV